MSRRGTAEEIVEILLPWGDSELPLHVSSARLAGVIRPTSVEVSAGAQRAAVREALSRPIGRPTLAELARGARSAAIVISDITRPCPSHAFLPALLAELESIPAERVTIICALGSHRPHSEEERSRLVGDEVAGRYTVVDLDEADCVPVATTSAGTPLEVFRPFLEADLRICTGNIEYHYFAGFSGGAKAMMPGICSRAAIQPNHGRMLHPRAKAGVLDGNPVREDIEEAGRLVRIDFIFNVIVDEQKRILTAVAGHPHQAFREGVRRYERLFDIRVPAPVDIVVASPGGHPKDINLYQAQKTLDNVVPALKKGGTIVLVARCPEGYGNGVFAEWMKDVTVPGELAARIARHFVLGGHKAAAIAELFTRANISLVSDFPVEEVEAMGMRPFAEPDTALADAFGRHGPEASVLVVPYGHRVRAAAAEGAPSSVQAP